MQFTVQEIARLIDLSAVRADTTVGEVQALAAAAVQYDCRCATTLPCHTRYLIDLLQEHPRTCVSGNVAFPSGAATSAIKMAEAQELLAMGCQELDMVLNIGLLRSGSFDRVLHDIEGVVRIAGSTPVKVILECHYLTEAEVRSACELCIQAGAAFVKTSTGWAPTGATRENVSLIRSVVGDALTIKASGGIRDLEMLKDLYHRGARRFGIGLRMARPILEQAAALS